MKTNKPIKWRTLVGLILLATGVAVNWTWIWGLLFLFWVIPDLFTGRTYFIEEIRKDKNPILYWIIVVGWMLLSLYYFSDLAYSVYTSLFWPA